MEIEVPHISTISVSEEKVINSFLETEHTSYNVCEGKVFETLVQTGDSYDVKSCSSELEHAKFGIEKLEDINVNISTSDACNLNFLECEIDTSTIEEREAAKIDNAKIERENIDENISLPSDEEDEENPLSLAFSNISADKSIAGKEQTTPQSRNPVHQYCFQATSNQTFSDISSVSSDSGMSGFDMELYRKSPYYKPQPLVKKEQEMRKESIVKTLEVTPLKGCQTPVSFYDSHLSYYKHLFNHVYALCEEAYKKGHGLSTYDNVVPRLMQFESISKDELEYLRGELESILGENYFDLSQPSDLSSTDGEYESDSFKSDKQVEIHTAKKSTEIEPEEQDKKEGNAEMKRNQTSPINLSIPSIEKTLLQIPLLLDHSPQRKHAGSPLLSPPRKVAVLAVPPTVKVVPKEKKTEICPTVTCSVSTQSTTTSTQQASIPDQTDIVSSSVPLKPETRHAIAEISSVKPLNTSLGQGQTFSPPKAGDKLYVLGYYYITSDNRTIKVEVHSKEGKANYQKVYTFYKISELVNHFCHFFYININCF